MRAASLVIATGGLTVPKIGATPFGYKVAEQFGLSVVPPRPALVPLALAPEWLARYGDLAGVALDAEVSCNGGRFRENLLFTHRGLSGPAILQISSYWDGKAPLAIDLLPGADAAAWFREPARVGRARRQRAGAAAAAAFRAAWCAAHDAAGPMARLPDRRFAAIEAALHTGGPAGRNARATTRRR